MGDFERTFGVGADAVGIIDGFCRHGRARPTARTLSAKVQVTSRQSRSDDYSEENAEIDPEGIPRSRLVIFSTYAALARWDARNHGLAFTRRPDDDGMYCMIMTGRRPGT